MRVHACTTPWPSACSSFHLPRLGLCLVCQPRLSSLHLMRLQRSRDLEPFILLTGLLNPSATLLALAVLLHGCRSWRASCSHDPCEGCLHVGRRVHPAAFACARVLTLLLPLPLRGGPFGNNSCGLARTARGRARRIVLPDRDSALRGFPVPCDRLPARAHHHQQLGVTTPFARW